MNERPIIMSAPMVRAILDGRKTQTRRVIKPQPERCELTGFVTTDKRGKRWATGIGFDEAGTRRNFAYRCPYGRHGDRLWVREAWTVIDGDRDERDAIAYRADDDAQADRWRSPIHMPRWASRITLEVTGVRVERLQEISEADAIAEGSQEPSLVPITGARLSERSVYAALWESINGPGSWDANPWVWVIEFRKVEHESAAA